jgi:hypothetical protein
MRTGLARAPGCLLHSSRLSGGTGAYAGITGHGIYRLNILIVSARNSAGNCSNKLPPVAFQQIIKAQGPVSL